MYRLPDEASNAELARLRTQSPSLGDELALCRLLAQQSAKTNPALSATLLGTAAKLSKEMHMRELREAEYVHRGELAKLGAAVVEAVLRHFRGACDDWEDRITRASEDVATLIEDKGDSL